jgi:microcystin-dependent protein
MELLPICGEIRIFCGTTGLLPDDWALCDGSLLQSNDYPELAELLGTTYGGDGTTTFGLPDLRGRVPIQADADQGYPLGAAGGAEQVALTAQQLPSHNHTFTATTVVGNYNIPDGCIPAQVQAYTPYIEGEPNGTENLNSASIGPSVWAHGQPNQGQPYGSNTPFPHSNMQPYQCINFIIALKGLFPSP